MHEQQSHHKEERIKLSLVEQELCEVRKALQKAEAEMEKMHPKSSKALQQWLLITYKKESKSFSLKKAKALKQMEEAKDAVSKEFLVLLQISFVLRFIITSHVPGFCQKLLLCKMPGKCDILVLQII